MGEQVWVRKLCKLSEKMMNLKKLREIMENALQTCNTATLLTLKKNAATGTAGWCGTELTIFICAKAVPLALDADPSQSTDEQAVGVGSRWSLALAIYNNKSSYIVK